MIGLSIILVIGFGLSWFLQRRRLADVRELSAKLTQTHERWSRDNAIWQSREDSLRANVIALSGMCVFHRHTIMNVCLDCKKVRGQP